MKTTRRTPDAVEARDAARRCAEYLKKARAEAIRAGSPRTLARIRLALTSCGGAIRHADGRVIDALYPNLRPTAGWLADEYDA